MRWRRRARVVLPLDEGPDMPTIRALGGGVESVILCVLGSWVPGFMGWWKNWRWDGGVVLIGYLISSNLQYAI